MAAAGPRLRFRTARSDNPEGAEEYKHLGGDAVDSAVDDADDGDHEATRNIRHGNTPFSGWVKRTWNNCPAAVTSVTFPVAAGAARGLDPSGLMSASQVSGRSRFGTGQ